VLGEGRVKAKLGRGGRAIFLPFGDVVDACCSTSVALLVGGASTAAESEAEGMTRWRVGASPRALQNSRTLTWSPVALIRPEVKMTPDWRSAKTETGSALSATEVLTARREDCDVRVVSGSGVPAAVKWSPRVVRGRNVVVRGDSDDAL
jgi:hypothetical protein